MPAVSSRRAEHAADTRSALLTAARELFTEQGYTATGTEQIVAQARVTRGALYHHFRDKADLFRAVLADVAREVAERLVAQQLAAAAPGGDAGAAGGPPEPAGSFAQLRAGFQAFLDVCTAGDFQRIVLVDGPAVLGPDIWDGLVEQYGYALLEAWLRQAMAAGEIDETPVTALVRLLGALLTQASLYIARADDPAAARADAGVAVDRLLAGLQR